jgi:hypothetical protein
MNKYPYQVTFISGNLRTGGKVCEFLSNMGISMEHMTTKQIKKNPKEIIISYNS